MSEKERVLVAMCCNMTGTEKMDVVVIGNSEQPRDFHKSNTKQVKFLYFTNHTACQNRSNIAKWIRCVNTKMNGR